ncbi:hypothetical protein HK099_001411 [Clydaea vesicula]|uniref:Hsp70 family protein n=1 Tax=Clydaea vesicula TaxID=447962 RepID=A0AAD5TU31_9FUNG|nr:hypothetical protein HK099_001411 [Clydaea vesicula]
MEKILDTNCRYFIGIDFGTTYSGYAFCHIADHTIRCNEKWEDAPDRYCKDKTCSLYSKVNGKLTPVAFGYKALNMFIEKKKDDDSLFFFEKFKLQLEKNDNYPSIKLPDNIDLEMIVSDYLKYLKDAAVPAIWSPQAKQFMREACYNAGIINALHSDKLLLCIEPEAASIFCKKVLKIGEYITVLDCGGGTIDIFSCAVLPNETLEEVHGSGFIAGSAITDILFMKYFQELTGLKSIDNKYTTKILKSWENLKKKFSSETDLEEMDFGIIDVDEDFVELLSEDSVEKILASQSLDSDEFLREIWISANKVKEILDDIIAKIIEGLKVHNSKIPQNIKISKILMVGGFSESEYLQKQISLNFEHNGVKLFCPSEGSAALRGQYSLIVSARTLRSTYGTDIAKIFDPEVDDTLFKDENGNWDNYKLKTNLILDKSKVFRIKNYFEAFVKAGERISNDYIIEKRFIPLHDDQKDIEFSIFSSIDKNVKLTTDITSSKVTSLTVNLPSELVGHSACENECSLTFEFGKTEIKIRAIHLQTNQKLETSLQFHSKKIFE